MGKIARVSGMVFMGLSLCLANVQFADARSASKSGSFGSRGERTFSAPPSTATAPSSAQPIQRSMTPNTAQPGFNQPGMAQPASRGLFGGLGGSLMGGLLMGGLFGMLLGYGFGGGGGLFGMLLQILLVIGIFMLVRRLFSNSGALSRSMPGAGGNGGKSGLGGNAGLNGGGLGNFMNSARNTKTAQQSRSGSDGVGIKPQDFDVFEARLKEMQRAYGAEDYGALRQITTPEAMSYLAEELGDNATHGLRNEVKDVRLLQGDLSEAWREGQVEYATVAMRYEAIDVMRNRQTGALVQGDETRPQQSVEIWTFTRRPGTAWLISAIQGGS